jgi:hypothetical protein
MYNVMTMSIANKADMLRIAIVMGKQTSGFTDLKSSCPNSIERTC